MPPGRSIRIPVHGFVEFSDWERDIINHPVFQRLRRIRQLAFSDHLYPGSVHTRFEHSIGVMHLATRLYDTLAARYEAVLKDRLGYDPRNHRSRSLVRLAALLHDVGHCAFSHGGEELMPTGLRHEDYSAELIRFELNDVINEHPENKRHFCLTTDEIADFYRGKSVIDHTLLFWRELVDGQLDADRMDYLLRDSLHCGVDYGHFDLGRIVDTLAVVQARRDGSLCDLRIGISEGGIHAAEGLIFARYFMFTQVYFHPVRKAYDHHAVEALRLLLRGNKTKHTGVLPDPRTPRGRRAFLKIDDWKVMDFIGRGRAFVHGEALTAHTHDRCVLRTPEVPNKSEIERFHSDVKVLQDGGFAPWVGEAEKEWYRTDKSDIPVADGSGNSVRPSASIPLSRVSHIVGQIKDSRQRLAFVSWEKKDEALRRLAENKRGD